MSGSQFYSTMVFTVLSGPQYHSTTVYHSLLTRHRPGWLAWPQAGILTSRPELDISDRDNSYLPQHSHHNPSTHHIIVQWPCWTTLNTNCIMFTTQSSLAITRYLTRNWMKLRNISGQSRLEPSHTGAVRL